MNLKSGYVTIRIGRLTQKWNISRRVIHFCWASGVLVFFCNTNRSTMQQNENSCEWTTYSCTSTSTSLESYIVDVWDHFDQETSFHYLNFVLAKPPCLFEKDERDSRQEESALMNNETSKRSQLEITKICKKKLKKAKQKAITTSN